MKQKLPREECAIRSIIAVVCSTLLILGMYLLSPQRTAAPVSVQVTYPEICDIADSVTLRGQVAERRQAALFAEGVSVVEQVCVRAGDMVQKGERLLFLRATGDPQQRSAARYADLETASQFLLSSDEDALRRLAEEWTGENTHESADVERQAYWLYSPFAGMIVSLNADVGDSVSSVFPCVTVSDLTALYIRAQADESAVKKLREGQSCMISVPALTDVQRAGDVTSISPCAVEALALIGEGERETAVEISTNNDDRLLRPGYSATIRVTTDVCPDALLIPFEAVAQDSDQQEYVMVLRDGRAWKQPVTTRYELENQVEVLTGVTKDDALILMPDGLHDGQEVNANAIS